MESETFVFGQKLKAKLLVLVAISFTLQIKIPKSDIFVIKQVEVFHLILVLKYQQLV